MKKLLYYFKLFFVLVFGGFDWKKRLRNRYFLYSLISSIVYLLTRFGLDLPDDIMKIIDSILVILNIFGIITDPTTEKLQDNNSELMKQKKINRLKGEYLNE